MGIPWSEYIRMPYNAAMAAYEGYIIRTQKADANFRKVAFQIYYAFSDHKDPRFTDDETKFWPLMIDSLFRSEKKKGVFLTKEQLLKVRNG